MKDELTFPMSAFLKAALQFLEYLWIIFCIASSLDCAMAWTKADLTHVELNSSALCAGAMTSHEAPLPPSFFPFFPLFLFFFLEFRSDSSLISS